MNDHDLKDLLNRLPREQASLGFRTRVLARIDEPRRVRAALQLGWGLAGAALVALVLTAVGWRNDAVRHEEELARLRLETLRTEYSELEGELRQLRSLVAASGPVVGVDGGGEYDYVLDLQEITRATGGNAFPVSYRLPE